MVTSTNFSAEELSIIRIYSREGFTRQSVLADLDACLAYISDKPLWKTVSDLTDKLSAISDEEFAALELDAL